MSQEVRETSTYSEVKAVNLTTFDKGLIQGRQEGRQEGQLLGMIMGLKLATELKFGRVSQHTSELLDAIQTIEDAQAATKQLKSSGSEEEFRTSLQRP